MVDTKAQAQLWNVPPIALSRWSDAQSPRIWPCFTGWANHAADDCFAHSLRSVSGRQKPPHWPRDGVRDGRKLGGTKGNWTSRRGVSPVPDGMRKGSRGGTV